MIKWFEAHHAAGWGVLLLMFIACGIMLHFIVRSTYDISKTRKKYKKL